MKKKQLKKGKFEEKASKRKQIFLNDQNPPKKNFIRWRANQERATLPATY